MSQKEAKKPKTTTIQVHQDLKDKLDLIKILGSHEDLNSVLNALTQAYIENSTLPIKPQIEKFLKQLKK